MKSKILKRTMAAALALTIVGGIPVAFDGNRIFQPAVTADAADEGSAVLNEETGVLTLSGRITKELLTEYKFRVEKIVCEQGTVLPADSSGLFSNGNIGEVIEIDLSNADTSEVTNMERMFYYQPNMTSLNISSFNTSNVTNMQRMFESCGSLSSLDVSSFDTSKVENMQRMFLGCKNIRSLNLQSFDTRNVTNMNYMFFDCLNLRSLDLSTFNTSKVTNMGSMFKLLKRLEKIYVSDGWSTEAVTVSDEMFAFSAKLVGGNGTKCNGAMGYKYQYAHPDGVDGKNGFLTYVSPAVKAEKAAVKGASISLGGKIGVNFYAELPANVKTAVLDGPNGKVVLNAVDIKGSRHHEDDEYKDTYKLTYDIDSDQADEKVSVAFYGEDDTTPIDVYDSNNQKDDDGFIDYSVNEYIAEVSEKASESTELTELVSALDDYCKASENYFENKNHEIKGINGINDFADLEFPYMSEEESEEEIDGKISLTLYSGTAMRIYFGKKMEICDYDKVDEVPYEEARAIKGVSKNGEYYEVPSFNAYDFLYDYAFYYKESGSEDNTITKTFSPVYAYTKRTFANPDSDEKLKDVLKALIVYGNKAKAYLDSLK